jgi:N-acetylmuramoyl-L-alanine amidase
MLMGEMKSATKLHKHPLKSAGFRVLKAPDVPSVLVELGYVSNKADLDHLVSDSWRSKTVGSMAQAIDAFLAKRLATAGPAN